MILADTSIWIDHLRSGNRELRKHLNHGNIVIHPFIITELALGLVNRRSLQERTKTLATGSFTTGADGATERSAAND